MIETTMYFDFFFFFVPSANMEGEGFLTDASVRHQGTIKFFWFHFVGAVMSSIFYMHSLVCMYAFATPGDCSALQHKETNKLNVCIQSFLPQCNLCVFEVQQTRHI